MAKLFVIPARREPTAIILRRGRSGGSLWYHLIQWDTRRDSFVHGAWFKGRIYESKCDLSPDGRLFVYFVHQGSRVGTDFTDAWTAVSRTPWLHALVLWPQGTTYGGGGRFVDDRQLVLRGVTQQPHKDFPLRGLNVIQGETPLHTTIGEVSDADWCGRDQEGRVIFSNDARLFRRLKSGDKLLADFSDLKPRPEPAPDWATRTL